MNFLDSLKEELKLLLFDKWLLASFTIIPIFLAFFVLEIFGSGQVKNIPLGVLDLDKSTYSKEITRMIDSSQTIIPDTDFTSYDEALKALKNRDIYGILIIPNNFQKNFKKGYSSNIQLFYNSQFILIGKSIISSTKKVLEYFNAKLKVIRFVSKGNTKIDNAINNSAPINMQMVPLYNQSLNYGRFLLVAIIPAIWQIIIVVSLVLSLTAQNNKTGIMTWIKSRGLKGFLAKLFIHQIFMMILCLGFLSYFSFYKSWFEIQNWTILLFAGWLCVVATQAMGSLFYFVSLSPAKALSLSAGFAAPSLAFMGITFPLSDMSTFAKIWSSFIPITHYIKVQVALTSYDFLSYDSLKYFFALGLFFVAFCLVFLIIKILIKKEIK